jgi:peroxiredoxin
MGAKVGDQISGVLQLGPWIDGMPTPVNMAERCKGKKVILVGLPGASLFSFFPKN